MSEYHIFNGLTSTGITLKNGDRMYVELGGTAKSTTIKKDGEMQVEGLALNTVISGGGEMEVDGSAVSTTILSGGEMEVDGYAKNVIVKNGGTLIVNHTASATDIDWTPTVGVIEFDEGADPGKVMEDVLKACRKVEPDCEIYF